MNNILSHIFTLEGISSLLNIILIDAVLSGDNALVIGIAVRKLQTRMRKRVIFWGIFLATVLRIALAMIAGTLLHITGLKLAGAFLLLYVVWKFYRELRTPGDHHADIHSKKTFWGAILTILIADFSMSLDNVLAVAGASHGSYVLMSIGLVISIVLMAIASHAIVKILDSFPLIQWIGMFVILLVAVDMILFGVQEIGGGEVLGIQILPSVVFGACAVFAFLHKKYIRPIDEQHWKQWISAHSIPLTMGVLTIGMVFLFFGNIISAWFLAHSSLQILAIFLFFVAILELLALLQRK